MKRDIAILGFSLIRKNQGACEDLFDEWMRYTLFEIE